MERGDIWGGAVWYALLLTAYRKASRCSISYVQTTIAGWCLAEREYTTTRVGWSLVSLDYSASCDKPSTCRDVIVIDYMHVIVCISLDAHRFEYINSSTQKSTFVEALSS